LKTRRKKSYALYLTGKEKIETPEKRRKWNNYIELKGAREKPQRGGCEISLNIMTVVTGVSGPEKHRW